MAGTQLTTIDEQAAVLAGEKDPQFLHAVLCQLGLPRNPTKERSFERRSGRASLRLKAGELFDGLKWNEQPLPYGTRPRLVLINLCSEAVRTQSPDVDLGGSVREFLRRLGIDANGRSMRELRQQMLALSVCHMTLGMATSDGVAQIDAKPIDTFQAWHTDEPGQHGLWTGRMRLTAKFFESLVDHAVPLDCSAIGELQNSAMALDAYSWLAHRLPRVKENNGIVLSWDALRGQFGQEYRDRKNFKREFIGALKKASKVYKAARLEVVAGGLKLLPSPPSVKRPMVALPPVSPARPEPSGKVRVSVKAIETARKFAPGFDIYALEADFYAWVDQLTEPLRLPPDQAFIGFVKGKAPARQVR